MNITFLIGRMNGLLFRFLFSSGSQLTTSWSRVKNYASELLLLKIIVVLHISTFKLYPIKHSITINIPNSWPPKLSRRLYTISKTNVSLSYLNYTFFLNFIIVLINFKNSKHKNTVVVNFLQKVILGLVIKHVN